MGPRAITCIVPLILLPTALLACLNDSSLALAEHELRSSYLPPAPPPAETATWIVPLVAALPWVLGALLVAGLVLILRSQRSTRWRAICALGPVAIGLLGVVIAIPIMRGVPAWYESALLDAHKRTGPAPHVLPRHPDGTGLRLAMVHDILHQRYPTHGEAWYAHRLERDRERLAAAVAARGDRPPDLDELRLHDDVVVALDRLHRSAEAVTAGEAALALLKAHHGPDPSAEQPRLEVVDRALSLQSWLDAEALAAAVLDERESAWYRCYANLGTVLVHGGMAAAIGGDAGARIQVARGRDLIYRALTINPSAHFGREAWQALAIGHLLAAIDAPDILLSHTMTGLPILDDEATPFEHGATTADGAAFRLMTSRVQSFDDAPLLPEFVTDADPAHGWLESTGVVAGIADHDFEVLDLVGFDQPTMALIGMWLYGGGPNPHSAFALGQLMERAGQRALAWSAYARALSMGQRFWSEPALREQWQALCRRRQAAIEDSLDLAPEILQDAFERELAAGEAWQAARQAFAAERLAAGADPDDPDFFAAFEAEHGPIATPPGDEDLMTVVDGDRAARGRGLWWLDVGLGIALISGLGLALVSREPKPDGPR